MYRKACASTAHCHQEGVFPATHSFCICCAGSDAHQTFLSVLTHYKEQKAVLGAFVVLVNATDFGV